MNSLLSISPVDGRYRTKVAKLESYFSEFLFVFLRTIFIIGDDFILFDFHPRLRVSFASAEATFSLFLFTDGIPSFVPLTVEVDRFSGASDG